jgi:uncharacterized membrane protein
MWRNGRRSGEHPPSDRLPHLRTAAPVWGASLYALCPEGGVMTLVVAVIFIAAQMLLNGYVLATVWAWHVVPVFHAPELSIQHAIGLAMMATLVTFRARAGKPSIADIIEYAFVHPLLVLLIAYVVRS